MLEWLNEILKSATVTDGALEVEKLQKAIEAEFPQHAVPKQDYNDKVKELATANNTIVSQKIKLLVFRIIYMITMLYWRNG